MAHRRRQNLGPELPEDNLENVWGGRNTAGLNGALNMHDCITNTGTKYHLGKPSEAGMDKVDNAHRNRDIRGMNNALLEMDSNQLVDHFDQYGIPMMRERTPYDTPWCTCTVVAAYGYMPQEILVADQKQAEYYHAYTRAGYQLWAAPLADAAYSRPWLVQMIKVPVICWARNMAAREGLVIPDHTFGQRLFGTVIEAVGVPICFVLGWLQSRLKIHS